MKLSLLFILLSIVGFYLIAAQEDTTLSPPATNKTAESTAPVVTTPASSTTEHVQYVRQSQFNGVTVSLFFFLTALYIAVILIYMKLRRNVF
jgi:hypothetical protein